MDNSSFSLNVTLAEAKDILNVLGQLPTSSNAWPLAQKIATQVQAADAAAQAAQAAPAVEAEPAK